MKKIWIFICILLLICGCSSIESSQSDSKTKEPLEMFSDRDFNTDINEEKSALIQLEGNTIECTSDAVKVNGNIATILDEGTYIVSGVLNDGMIIVNADKQDKVQIVLKDASIHSDTSAALYIIQADKVFVTLSGNNVLTSGETFVNIDENNIDAVIFSKEDLTINGTGSLKITSSEHGIVSKDELTLTGGNIEVTCASHGLSGKDGVLISNVRLNVISGKDGIHAENKDDETSGIIYIESGTFDIASEGDGISAQSELTIYSGTFNIVTGGGSENGEVKTSEFWGGMRPGGRPGQSSQTTTEDSTSIKGIKSSGNLLITGGTFVINSADDAIHSNADVTIQEGVFDIASGDDAFHADETLSIESGTISVTGCYEGLEGLHVLINGGTIRLVCTDDGLNAAGGTDSSGFGGPRGDRFGGSSDGSVVISGGTLNVIAYGDGIDANGTLEMTGGWVSVAGPTRGDTATLDYDISAVISGGTFIGTGSTMMAQTFSDSTQGVIALQVGNRDAETEITLTDEKGNIVVQYAPELSYAVVILSTEEMVKGKTYHITVGEDTGSFEAY